MYFVMDDCIFCKIVKGEIPAKKVYENNSTVVFLDINPANYGHCLVIPKTHTESIFTIDDETISQVAKTVRKIANIVKSSLKAEGVNIVQNNGQAAGQVVNHFHIHVIPRYKNDNVIITYQRKPVDEKIMDETLKKLKGKEINEDIDLDF